MRENSTSAALLALLALLLGAAECALAVELRVASAADFVGGVQQFGRSNSDVTILLPPGATSLRNATFGQVLDAEAVGGKAYDQGTLTIVGATDPATGARLSFLDLGNRWGLTPTLSRGQVHFVNVTLFGACLNAASVSNYIYNSSVTLQIFNSSYSRRSLTFTNTTVLVPEVERQGLLFIVGMFRVYAAWTPVERSYPALTIVWPNLNGRVTHLNATAFTLTATLASFAADRLTYTSSNDPNGALVQAVRAQGLHQPMLACFSGGVAIEQYQNDTAAEPLMFIWVADTLPDAVARLRAMPAAAARAVRLARIQFPIPAAVLNVPSLALSESVLPGGLDLDAPLQLWGPFNDDPSHVVPWPLVDLSGRTTPLFNLTATGQIFVARMVFDLTRRPASASGTALRMPLLARDTGAPTQIPNATTFARQGTSVNLFNATFIVPPLDYLALLLLATNTSINAAFRVRQCLNETVRQHAARMVDDGATLLIDRPISFDIQVALRLSTYVGYDVNATLLIVRPSAGGDALLGPAGQAEVAAALAGCPALLVQPIRSQGANSGSAGDGDDSGGGGLSGGTIGIIVGCTVGGAVLLLAAAALAVAAVRRRRRAEEEKAADAVRRQGTSSCDDSGCQATNGHAAICLHGGAAAAATALPPAGTGGMESRSGSHADVVDGIAADAVGKSPKAAVAAAGSGGASRVPSSALGGGPAGPAAAAAAGLEGVDVMMAVATPGESQGPDDVPPSIQALLEQQLAAEEQRLLVCINASATFVSGISVLRQAHEMLMSQIMQQSPAGGAGAGSGDAGGGGSGNGGGGSGQQTGSGGRARQASGGSGRGQGGGDVAAAARGSDGTRGTAGSGSGSDVSHRHLIGRVQDIAGRLQGSLDAANKVTIHDVLGRGGCGIVYLGEWRGLPVAVKTMVFEAHHVSDKRRAVMETAIAASVGHRNVVATYHYDIKRVGEQPELLGKPGLTVSVKELEDASSTEAFKAFLVQELCNSTLRQTLQSTAFASWRRSTGSTRVARLELAYSLMLDVAKGLEYLHSLGIIHGDLTPANVMIKLDHSSDHQPLLAKLTDFGLSHRLDQQATHVSNVFGGTPFYVAPEVMAQGRVSTAADMYGFGVLMWQVYTAQEPFVQRPDGVTAANPLFPGYEPGDDPPPPYLQLAARCLSADPRARPTAVQAVTTLVMQLASLSLHVPRR